MYYMCRTCVSHMYLLHMSYTCICTHVIHLKHHTHSTTGHVHSAECGSWGPTSHKGSYKRSLSKDQPLINVTKQRPTSHKGYWTEVCLINVTEQRPTSHKGYWTKANIIKVTEQKWTLVKITIKKGQPFMNVTVNRDHTFIKLLLN